MSVKVIAVPTQGNPVEHEAKEGMTVAEAAEAAGISLENKNVTISTNKVVKPADFATRRLKAGETLQVAERPQGS